MWVILLDVKPKPKQRHRIKRQIVILPTIRITTQMITYTPSETKRFQRTISWIVKAYLTAHNAPIPLTCPVGIGWIATKSYADRDNIDKAILDALQGVVYRNDRQVVEGFSFLLRKAPKAFMVLFIWKAQDVYNKQEIIQYIRQVNKEFKAIQDKEVWKQIKKALNVFRSILLTHKQDNKEK